MYNLVLHSRLKVKGPVSSQCKNLLHKVWKIYFKLKQKNLIKHVLITNAYF